MVLNDLVLCSRYRLLSHNAFMYSWCYTYRSKVWTLGGLVPPMTASDVFSAAPFFPAMQSGYLGTLLKTIVPAITSSKLCWIF